MSGPADDLVFARQRAIQRRVAGILVDFDPHRLALARRLNGMQRTRLARAVGVTAAAVTQFEKGQSRPTMPIVQGMAQTLGVGTDFFRAGHPVEALPSSGAHFRSLRSTTALERDRALAFAEVVQAVFAAVEQHVDLPMPAVPALDVPPELSLDDVARLAREARAHLDIGAGPVPNMVRLLEARGVLVVRLDAQDLHRVDAFSHHQGRRPIVLLNPAKGDKARSRFDAAHELGHLVMHHDTEPGSRLVENQAHAFAAEFLAPTAEIVNDMPQAIDWPALQKLKQRWGISLKALVVRARNLGFFNDNTYQRAMRQLAAFGFPEPGGLGPPETPVLLARSMELLGGVHALPDLADEAGLPSEIFTRVWLAAGGEGQRPSLLL